MSSGTAEPPLSFLPSGHAISPTLIIRPADAITTLPPRTAASPLPSSCGQVNVMSLGAEESSVANGVGLPKLSGHLPCSSSPSSQALPPGIPTLSSTSSLAPALDDTLCEALRSSRDRVFLLRQEQDMVDFIGKLTISEHVLPLMNSYQRLLVHRCADYYRLHRDVDPETKVVRLTRTVDTSIPPLRISQLLDQIDSAPRPGDESPFAMVSHHRIPLSVPSRSGDSTPADLDPVVTSPPSAVPGPSSFRIMRRDPSMGHSTYRTASANDAGSEPGRKNRKDMTIEEREAAYREARERIFGAASLADAEGSATAAESSTTSRRRDNSSATSKTGNPRTIAPGSILPTQSVPDLYAHSSGEDLGRLASTSQYEAVDPQFQSTHYGWFGAAPAIGTPPIVPGQPHPLLTNRHDAGMTWPQYPISQLLQQQGSSQPPYWSPYQQQPMSGQVVFHPQPLHHNPQASYQYPHVQSHWQSPSQQQQQQGFYHAQQSPHNGSTSNLSSVDVFSPFPPTPSTNSSAGIPSPAPSVSGSSNSAVSGRARGSRPGGGSDGTRDRRGSRASNSSDSLAMHRGAVGQSGLPQITHRAQQQGQQLPSLQQHGATSTASNSRSTSPTSTRAQGTDGHMTMTPSESGGETSGRLNVADRTLFDPNRGGSNNGGESPAHVQLSSLKAHRGAGVEIPSHISTAVSSSAPLYATSIPPQETASSVGAHGLYPWGPLLPPGAYALLQPQAPPYRQHQLSATASVASPYGPPISGFASGIATPPAGSAALQARPQHAVGSSSIRLGSVLPASVPPSTMGASSEKEAATQTQQNHQKEINSSSISSISTIPALPTAGLPARPDWVLTGQSSPQDVRSAALASLPGANAGVAGGILAKSRGTPKPTALRAHRATASETGQTTGQHQQQHTLEAGSLTTTPRSSCRSLHECEKGSSESESGSEATTSSSTADRSARILLLSPDGLPLVSLEQIVYSITGHTSGDRNDSVDRDDNGAALLHGEPEGDGYSSFVATRRLASPSQESGHSSYAPWRIDNAYYTAQVHFRLLSLAPSTTQSLRRRTMATSEQATEDHQDVQSRLAQELNDVTAVILVLRGGKTLTDHQRVLDLLERSVALRTSEDLAADITLASSSSPGVQGSGGIVASAMPMGFGLAVSTVICLPSVTDVQYVNTALSVVSSPASREVLRDFYAQNGWEYIDLDSDVGIQEHQSASTALLHEAFSDEEQEDSDLSLEDEVGDEARGLERVREALEANMWSGLIRKERPSASSSGGLGRTTLRALDASPSSTRTLPESRLAALSQVLHAETLSDPQEADQDEYAILDANLDSLFRRLDLNIPSGTFLPGSVGLDFGGGLPDGGGQVPHAEPTAQDEELARRFLASIADFEKLQLAEQVGIGKTDEENESTTPSIRTRRVGTWTGMRKDANQSVTLPESKGERERNQAEALRKLEEWLKTEDGAWPGVSDSDDGSGSGHFDSAQKKDGIATSATAEAEAEAAARPSSATAQGTSKSEIKNQEKRFDDDFDEFVRATIRRSGPSHKTDNIDDEENGQDDILVGPASFDFDEELSRHPHYKPARDAQRQSWAGARENDRSQDAGEGEEGDDGDGDGDDGFDLTSWPKTTSVEPELGHDFVGDGDGPVTKNGDQ